MVVNRNLGKMDEERLLGVFLVCRGGEFWEVWVCGVCDLVVWIFNRCGSKFSRF